MVAQAQNINQTYISLGHGVGLGTEGGAVYWDDVKH